MTLKELYNAVEECSLGGDDEVVVVRQEDGVLAVVAEVKEATVAAAPSPTLSIPSSSDE